jgi:SM-20-related protein
MKEQFEGLIQSYIEQQVGIDQEFLSERLAEGLLQHIHQLQLLQLMKPAGIGNDLLKDPLQQTRGDKIYWLDKSHDNPFEQEFLLLMDSLILYLNRTCYAGIQEYEFHLTASFLWYVTSIKTGRRPMGGNFGCIMQMGYKRYHPNSSARFFSKAMN